ncbi:MAG: hypothetical protein NTV57_09725 [Cyanobacteria bacterium]|nr:hypothetical protein [Cyanobacteriota bacterium]
MFNSLLLQLHRFGQRLQSFEQSLFRKEIVLPFLLVRLTLIVAMLLCFYLAFNSLEGFSSPPSV